GANLFGDCLLALDARTGKRLWHFQMVHHDIWDYDNATAPKLLTVRHDGTMVDVVAQAGKTGFLYVFDRVTGQPVWPIEERPVPQSDIPSEKTSPTQPYPTKPPAYARQFLKPEDLIDFTPQLHDQALQALERYKIGTSLFTPPILGSAKGTIAIIGPGTATNWPGSAYDPELHTVFAQAGNTPGARSLTAPP